MTLPVFGVVFHRVDEEPRPVIAADLSTVGLVGPAPNADPDTFPLDTPVKLYSNDTTKATALGTAGYLLDTVNAINNPALEQAAQIVVVRTAMKTDPDPGRRAEQTIGKIMGSSTDGTGVWALLKSGDPGIFPRLIIAPGYTSQMANSVRT